MQFILDLKNLNELHHFYLVKSPVLDLTSLRNSKYKDEIELIEFNYDIILVDHAREISDFASRKISKEKKFLFFIKANNINSQAQNALLKSLEETTPGLHFFFVLPELQMILPTVLSRAMVIEEEVSKASANNIFKLNPTERLKIVEDLAKEIKDEKKTKRDAIDFVDGIISELSKDLVFKKNNSELFKKIINSRDFINDNGASTKSILEFVVLSVPSK